MDALSEAIARLLRRQETTERRLAEIESALGIARAPLPQPEPPPPPRVAVPPPPPPPPPMEAAPPPLPPQPETTRLETKVGLAWVNRIGVVTFALFVAFAFKYAVDSAVIGPSLRVVLGVAAGLVALVAG